MEKVKYIAFILILLCMVVTVSSTFAADNETLAAVDDGDVLTEDYYFDASVENDTGNGTIDNPYKQLTTARIKENSNIYLNEGEYELNDYKRIYNVNIIGKNPETTIIKNLDFEVTFSNSFTLHNVTLVNCRITNHGDFNASNTIFIGSSSSNGGGLYSDENANLDNCTFANNTASGYGGAIYVYGGVLNISNSLFVDNRASDYGGAIAGRSYSTIEIDNTVFKNNYASNRAGGALYLIDSELRMSNSQLINSTSVFGGAITLISSDLNATNITARNNKAKYYGGAVYSLYGDAVIVNSTFNGNSARDGGALFIDDADVFKIDNNHFANNFANYSAGAVCAISNNGSIADNNIFENNSAILENDVYQSSTPFMTIGDSNYILINTNGGVIGDLPSSYDLRDEGYVTPVKAQGGGGNCWAFSSLAALESCILKATGTPYDLSEENMKNLMSKFSDYGWNYEPNTGGLDNMAVGYLVSWLGPVNESENQYDASSFLSPTLHSFIHVQNVLYITRQNHTDNDEIKRAIMEYGAVSTSIAWYGTYLNNRFNYYCYNSGEKANHAVTIVGWDDNYSKSNFKGNPEGDGAWIIKNSWGTGSGMNGFYYVSYYDAKMAEPGKSDTTYTFIFNDAIKYDKNYQYDIPGKTDFFLNESSTVWYKNRFNATDNEYLAAVSTIFSKDTNYTLSVYVNDELKITQEGFSKEGYYTLPLNEFIPLAVGDIFEVVFKITVDGEAMFPVSEKISLEKLFYKENISFLSYDGINWKDLFNLTWDYSSHTYKSQVACIKAFTVFDLVNTTTELKVNVTDSLNVEVIVLNQYSMPVNLGNVTITVNNMSYVLDVKDGRVLMQLPFVSGQYNISAVYDHALGFRSSKDNVSFDNSTINTSIDFSIATEYNPINITAHVVNEYGYSLNCGNVTFTVEGKDYTVEVCNGTASLIHIFPLEGSYEISVRYNGFDYYNPSNYGKSVVVYLPTTDINIFTDDKCNPYDLVAVVTDQLGNFIESGNVTFTVEGQNVTVPIIEGYANLTYNFTNPGINNIQASFSKTGFIGSSVIVKLYVYTNKADMAVNITKYDYLNVIIEIDLSKELNETAEVSIVSDFNVSSYMVNITDGKGQLNLNDLAYGKYNVTVSVNDDMYYIEDVNDTFSITNVATYITADDLETYYDSDFSYCAYLYDSNGSPLASENVIFSMNGEKFNAITDSNGKASLLGDFKSGNYKVEISFNGEGKYLKSNITKEIIIKSTVIMPTATKYTFNANYVVYLYDSNGKPLENQTVSLKINSDAMEVKTDANGRIKVVIDMNPGTYSFAVTNPKTSEVKTQKITVVKRITENSAVTMYYGAGKYYKVKVFDDNGNIAKSVEVTFKIAGKSYKRTTDSKGYASFKITQKPGKYTITAEYKGFKVSNKVTVKSTIVTKDIKVKKGKTITFPAKLLDKNGKILKNKKVTFKFKGKTYNVKTNKKGIATLKITKKYKKGKYSIQTTYGSLTVKNTIKII